MDQKKKTELEEEMSRFEQEISGQLPPPPQPPAISASSESSDNQPEYSDAQIYAPPVFSGHSDHPHFPEPHIANVEVNAMHPPGPMLPHLPPLPPLPHGLPLPDGPNLQMPTNIPQFVPPPLPPVIINPVPVQSTPVIKPPTVPLDNYDPTEVVEEKSGEAFTGDMQKGEKRKGEKRKFVRVGGGQTWEDETLADWDPSDFRLFCGDLGNEVTDEYLFRAFAKYPSVLKAKVVRDKKTKKTKGYGFVSFKDPQDYLRAMREMNGKYVGNRPIKLRKSTWRDRNIDIARKKEKEKKKLGLR